MWTLIEVGYEKIALYALGVKPTHAARQTKSGKWTHKMGSDIDLETTLKGVEGPKYGKSKGLEAEESLATNPPSFPGGLRDGGGYCVLRSGGGFRAREPEHHSKWTHASNSHRRCGARWLVRGVGRYLAKQVLLSRPTFRRTSARSGFGRKLPHVGEPATKMTRSGSPGRWRFPPSKMENRCRSFSAACFRRTGVCSQSAPLS